MRLLPFLASLPLTAAAGEYQFINPPAFGTNMDYSNNPVYELGSVVNVAWNPGPPTVATSLTLWQLDPLTGVYFGNLEYVTQKTVNISTFRWIVETTKDLTTSHLFYLTIFEDGQFTGAVNSHYFNLTQPSAASSATPSSTASSTTASTSSSMTATGVSSSSGASSSTSGASVSTTTSASVTASSSAATQTSSTTAALAAASSDAAATDSAGLSTGAKIGIGVAIPGALILGGIASWLLFRRTRGQAVPLPTVTPHMSHGSMPHGSMPHGSMSHGSMSHDGMAGRPSSWAGQQWMPPVEVDGKFYQQRHTPVELPATYHEMPGMER